jgi:hypothetical protein
MSLSHYPINPLYGHGTYRRRIRLSSDGERVTAILNDDYHAMGCCLIHDGTAVLSVESELLRGPKTTCAGASAALGELVGTKLNVSRREFYRYGRPGRNCTHLLDLALLCLGHAQRGQGDRIIDVAIHDELAGVTHMVAQVDGRLIHDWLVVDERIQEPIKFAGQRLFSGFAAWAESVFAADDLDAARMLQKGVFVARGRRYILDGTPGNPTEAASDRRGDCYSFSEPRLSIAQDNLDYSRDFTQRIKEVFPSFFSPTGKPPTKRHERERG